MRKEGKSELERLEEALLEEEEILPEELPEEADVDRAYANFANGYQVYNTDTSDEDMEDYSDEVYRAETASGGVLRVILLVIGLLLLGFVIGWLLRYLGVL